MRAHRVLTPALAVWLAASLSAAAPTSIEHTPPPPAESGAPVPLSVRLGGVPDGEPQVVLHYRGASTREFKSLDLLSRGGGVYAGVIPAGDTNDLRLSYWIEVNGPGRAYRLSLGSAGGPLQLNLLAPQETRAGSSPAGPIFVGLGVLFLALAGGMRHAIHRRRRMLLEDLFWYRTLYPLLSLPADQTNARLQQMSQTPLDHPSKGSTQFPYLLLSRKIREVKSYDLRGLLLELDRLGERPGPMPVAADPSATVELKAAARLAAKGSWGSEVGGWRKGAPAAEPAPMPENIAG